GSAQVFTQVCFTVKGGGPNAKVTNATPGVFFYYAKIIAPSASFTVHVLQTKSCSGLGLFALQQDQIVIWDPHCNTALNQTINTSTAADASITITGATPGALYVISVKYDTKSIVGTTA